MSINMADAKKIEMPGTPITIYKQTFSFTNANVHDKATGNQGYIRCTIYSNTTPTWSGSTETDLYNYLRNTLGYNVYASDSRVLLVIDNVYDIECDVTVNNVLYSGCVISTFQVRSSGLYPYCQHPDSQTTVLLTNLTISASEWESIGTYTDFDFVCKQYTGTNPPYSLTISKNNITGQEYIANYAISGVQYPNVTISSVSDNSYTLSDGNTYNVTNYLPKSWNVTLLEVVKIENLQGTVLWQKPSAQAYYIKYGSYYINKSGVYNVSSATTATTVWYLESDNRLYCLVNDVKYYLQFQTSGNFVVFVDTTDGSGYQWIYKDGNSITGVYNNTTYYLYRYETGSIGVRMRTNATTLTFEPVS